MLSLVIFGPFRSHFATHVQYLWHTQQPPHLRLLDKTCSIFPLIMLKPMEMLNLGACHHECTPSIQKMSQLLSLQQGQGYWPTIGLLLSLLLINLTITIVIIHTCTLSVSLPLSLSFSLSLSLFLSFSISGSCCPLASSLTLALSLSLSISLSLSRLPTPVSLRAPKEFKKANDILQIKDP